MAQREIIWPFFFIALFFSLGSFAPLTAFAPFLVIAFYRYPLVASLWIAAGCGLILDLLTTTPFGIYTLNYVAVSFFLFNCRSYFVEKPIGLASLTLIFSTLSSILARISFWTLGITLPLTLKGAATDFVVMPLFDGIYSLLCFSCPLILFRLVHRQWFRFLFLRKETKEREEEELNSYGK
ncbi:MAG: hypothetical protein K1060chlam2_00073 [Chlamydiae bacterium]|nr:hypothetical protein [Chlamydiota bacterium]